MIEEKTVKGYLDLGLNVIPIGETKMPTIPWKPYQENMVAIQSFNSPNLGLITGKISGNLEVIDLDQKYYSGNLLKELGKLVSLHNEKLWEKLVVQETKNGGWHLLYRCEEIEGNKKISSRYATDKEKEGGEKVKVLIETRGEGGYICVWPSIGYSFIHGKLGKIPHITKKERLLLHTLCGEFDETGEVVRKYGKEGVTPWADYDAKHTCREVLERNEWSFVFADSKREYFRRPGTTSAAHSGNVLVDDNLFKSWSTSTEFEPEKAYTASGVLCVLEHGGDWSRCATKLVRDGYGEKRVEQDTGDVSKFVISAESIDKESENFFEHGAKYRGIGLPELDYYLPWRDNAFYTFTGGRASGKTTLLLYLMAQDAWVNGTKNYIRSFENDAMELQNEVIGFLCGDNAEWVYKKKRKAYNWAREWFHEHFKMIKTPPDYNFFSIIKLVEQLQGVQKCDRFFIDPLFKVAETDSYENNKKIAAYAEPFANDVMSLFISMHPKGSTQREGGQPTDLSAEFGALYSNAADITCTLARDYKDPDPSIRRTVNFSIDKMRSKKTLGGNETIKNNPIKFEYLWKANGYRIWVPNKDEPDDYDVFNDVFFKNAKRELGL